MDLNINLERNHYYSGKKMDKEDLILEQDYFIDKIKTVNKMLVGYGIIRGLKIGQLKNNEGKITINEGIGIDSHGNFITLLSEKEYLLPQTLVSGDYIYLKYIDSSSDRIPVGDINSCSETCTSNHIIDDTEIFISNELVFPKIIKICTEKDSAKKDPVKEDEKIKEALLYLGQYKVDEKSKMGSLDVSQRKYVYTNDEIFKLLCSINQNYVSSVNGKNGALNLVSAIGDVLPDEDGLINLVAGNNIKLENEDNEIKISTKGGFHKEYYLSIARKNPETDLTENSESSDSRKKTRKGVDEQIINHNRATFPTVDVYERVINTGRRLVRKSEIEVEARDLSMDFEEYKTEHKILLFSDEFKDVINANKKLTVSSVLKKNDINEVSSKVIKLSEKRLAYYIEDLYIVPLFSYKKIVGGTDTINIEVSHENSNSVKLKNLSSKRADVLVILST